jgi:nucleoside-diphosphate-sugar epimerase
MSHRIYLTGSSGFVGTSIRHALGDRYAIDSWTQGSPFAIAHDAVIHLAGIAHDLKNTSSPDTYYEVNTELTKKLFDAFLASDAQTFIFFSSVKAAADQPNTVLTEAQPTHPATHYGISKLLAEQYILSQVLPDGKRVYILRPAMIHGPGNKGNLNLLYTMVRRGLPWPLGAFENRRSFCSIDNVIFTLRELIERDDIPSGIYNLCDDEPLSTNDLILGMAESLRKKARIWRCPQGFIRSLAKTGDVLSLPLNTERLQKLTESYVLSNHKLLKALGKPLPVRSHDGLHKTFHSFANADDQAS